MWLGYGVRVILRKGEMIIRKRKMIEQTLMTDCMIC
jgi:hypothetical protein